MTSSSTPTTYVRRPGLNAVAMDGELVMMGLEQGEYYGLRDVATSIWQHLERPRSLADLCALVSAEYAVSDADCQGDVREFLDQLLAKKLIEAA